MRPDLGRNFTATWQFQFSMLTCSGFEVRILLLRRRTMEDFFFLLRFPSSVVRSSPAEMASLLLDSSPDCMTFLDFLSIFLGLVAARGRVSAPEVPVSPLASSSGLDRRLALRPTRLLNGCASRLLADFFFCAEVLTTLPLVTGAKCSLLLVDRSASCSITRDATVVRRSARMPSDCSRTRPT